MAITRVTRLENRSKRTVALFNMENTSTEGHGVAVPPGGWTTVSMFVPWATNADQFRIQHLELRVDGQTRFWIWQAHQFDGDHLRFSRDGQWRAPGARVHGASVVDDKGERTIVAMDGCFEVVAIPDDLVRKIVADLPPPAFTRAAAQPPDPRDRRIPSVPRHRATAFSVAGPPSDAFDLDVPNARFLYRDGGKRYDFEVDANGLVSATSLDGTRTELPHAVSYDNTRAGERFPAPRFDLIAANQGRVIAKAAQSNQLYFTTMDHLFVHGDPSNGELVVPSMYFKLDPQFRQPGRNAADALDHIKGCFADHPAVERLPLFRLALDLDLTDMLIVRVERRVWHRIDARPPLEKYNAILPLVVAAEQALEDVGTTLPDWRELDELRAKLAEWKELARLEREKLEDPGYDPFALPKDRLTGVQFVEADEAIHYSNGVRTMKFSTIKHYRVLDLGIGHAHWHEVYDGTTGGEMQPMRTGPAVGPLTWAELYRVLNGPISDGDGYIDGTANFYALVQLKDDSKLGGRGGLEVGDAFGVLYVDEQTYFNGRWRLLHPDDHVGGGFAVALALTTDHERPDPLYDWDPATYWCPFRAGHITRRSRMATSRQVVAVNGIDPATNTAEIYTINSSYSSMDRTWRWRRLPPDATVRYFADDAAAGREVIPAGVPGDVVYPETLRLREDMTLHVRGSRAGVVGRWVQRYLPSSNTLPAMSPGAGGRPTRGFAHPWRFVTEAAFQVADRFSHLGVYDAVDGRSQYYRVSVDATSAAVLAKSTTGPWLDTEGRLGVRSLKFWWAAPLRVPNVDVVVQQPHVRPSRKVPPSIFNPVTQLRITKRGSSYIATHWDKRDDDLLPFSPQEDLLGNPTPPSPVTLTNGGQRISATLTTHVPAEAPPVISYAEFAWTGDPGAPAALLVRGHARVWRVRLAVVEPPAGTTPARVVHLRTAELTAFAATGDGGLEHRWTPTATETALLQKACSPEGAQTHATAIWVEDVTGKVSVPDVLAWRRLLTAAATPAVLPYGVPATLTVVARDAGTAAVTAGSVHLPDGTTRPTGTPFSHTFVPGRQQVFDPEIRKYVWVEVPPVVRVSAPGFRDTSVPLQFQPPQLRTSVDQAWLPVGRTVQVTVRVADSLSGAAVAGRVLVNGVDAGPTNTPFPHTSTSAAPVVTVTAAGYPTARVAWPPLRVPRLEVGITPHPVPVGTAVSVTVRAVDADSRAAVDGVVLVNGVAVGRTNAAFTYTFFVRRTRVRQDGVWVIELIPPTMHVSASGYPDAPVDLGL